MAGQPEVKMSGNVEVTTRMGAAYLSVGKIAVYVHHVWAVPLFLPEQSSLRGLCTASTPKLPIPHLVFILLLFRLY